MQREEIITLLESIGYLPFDEVIEPLEKCWCGALECSLDEFYRERTDEYLQIWICRECGFSDSWIVIDRGDSRSGTTLGAYLKWNHNWRE